MEVVDRRPEVAKAIAEELLAIQQGSVDDAIALAEDMDLLEGAAFIKDLVIAELESHRAASDL